MTFRLHPGAWAGAPDDAELDALRDAAAAVRGDIDGEWDLVRLAGERIGAMAPGNAARHLVGLAALAAVDLTIARRLEPHLDALGILRQAGLAEPDGVLGVFAAEAPGARLEADDGHVLRGRKPWCSLAAELDHALVTAHAPGGRRLLLVDLRHPGVAVQPAEGWVAKGLPRVPSTPVDFDAVPAVPVGEVGWYLDRPGFALGGIAVAACWWGGAVGLLGALDAYAVRKRDDPLALLALGEAAVALHGAELSLAAAARAVDERLLDDEALRLLAQRVRSTVRGAADRIRSIAVATLGPAPLAFDADYAQRVADLELYTAQDHGARDLARLGSLLLEREDRPW